MAKNHSDLLLRLIIIEKTLLSFLALLLSAGILSLINRDMDVMARELAVFLNLDTDSRFMMMVVQTLTMVDASKLIWVSLIGVLYSGLNFVEAYGLYKRYRWAEYLTVIATGLFIPFELYELIKEPRWAPLVMLVLNVLIVLFLAKHKELFPNKVKASV